MLHCCSMAKLGLHRYLAFGSSMDYMYEELHVQYPLTVEVCLLISLPSTRPLCLVCLSVCSFWTFFGLSAQILRCGASFAVHMSSFVHTKLLTLMTYCDSMLKLRPFNRCMDRMDWGRQQWEATHEGTYPTV